MGLFDFLSPETHNTELKVKVEKLKEPSLPDGFYGIFMKGFPSITSQKSKHSILIELVDVTDEENVTEVYPLLNEQKHPFYNFFYIEHQSENLYRKGWTDWNQIGAFHLNHLQSAYSGIRKLKLSLFILKSAGRDEYLSNLPSIKGEFTEDWSETSFSLELTRPGYTEANKAQIKIQTAAIKLAVSIAYADGSFDNEEGLTIKKWIESILSRKLESQKSDLKKLFNNALENAYKELKSGVFNVDLVCDGEKVVVGAIMQHIEQAGIHSGDSACSLPPYNLPTEVQDLIRKQVTALALELGVVGLMNTQLAYQDGEIYINI